MARHHHHRSRRRSDSGSDSAGSSDASASDGTTDSRSSDGSLKKRHSSGHRYEASDLDDARTEDGWTDDSDEADKPRRRRDHRHHRDDSDDDQRQRQLVYFGCGIVALVMLVVAWRISQTGGLSLGGSTGVATATSTGGSGTDAAKPMTTTTEGTTSPGTSSSRPADAGASGSASRTDSGSPASSVSGPLACSDTSADKSGTASSAGSASTPVATNAGPYKLVQDWSGDNFFDGWTFFADADPTHGQVTYLDQDAAKSANLISTSAGSAIMRVDNTTKLDAGKPRDSVRLHSKTAMKMGSIVIADIKTMPWGCATWPAWWSNGPDWPNGGEIDVVEGVNVQTENAITLHVSDSNCKQDTSVDVTGTPIEANNDCNANVNGNQGCSFQEVTKASYGEEFHKAGGGVFVTSFTADAISVWFWSRPNVPQNIQDGAPDSATWGIPTAMWPKSSCEIEKYFKEQTLIFDTTLCGDWAGATGVWSTDCADAAATCSDYVADPTHFDTAFWDVGYVRVYEI